MGTRSLVNGWLQPVLGWPEATGELSRRDACGTKPTSSPWSFPSASGSNTQRFHQAYVAAHVRGCLLGKMMPSLTNSTLLYSMAVLLPGRSNIIPCKCFLTCFTTFSLSHRQARNVPSANLLPVSAAWEAASTASAAIANVCGSTGLRSERPG